MKSCLLPARQWMTGYGAACTSHQPDSHTQKEALPQPQL
nr:MAG TPA: hypothetical protein [Caudoviricetes sp.]